MSLAAMVMADRSERLVGVYDRWIEVVTLGRARPVREAVLAEIGPGQRLLDAGCGTGTLAVAAARAGATVVGIDRSAPMLAVARRKAAAAGVEVDLRQGDIAFPPVGEERFDVVSATFVLGELSSELAALAVRRLAESLRPGGRLVIADEAPPETLPGRLLGGAVRAVQGAVAFMALQQLAPSRRHRWRALLEGAGLEILPERSRRLGGLFVLVAGRPRDLPRAALPERPLEDVLPRGATGLARRAAAWLDLPVAVRPGVYRIGDAGPGDPVLLTGNFLASVEAVRAGLGDRAAHLVVEDSDGWNVWCAGDAGLFSAEQAVALMERHDLDALVDRHRIVVPRLGGRVRPRLAALTGWEVVVGPIEARDLPAFLATGLSPEMRSLRRLYGPGERLRVGALTAVQLPVFLLPLRLLPPGLGRPAWRFAMAAGWLLPLAHDVLPGATGVVKGAGLGGLVALVGVLSGRIRSRAALVLVACSPLVGWVYQSSSPVVFWKRMLR
jgi:ubiquinone/menaquinone biosynthesis C-methylase UbiE